MKLRCSVLLCSAALAIPILVRGAEPSTHAGAVATERLGTVSFSNSCAPSLQVSFNRGVALLHDFWYDQAERQFTQIAKADPSCAMAYWGQAMSEFHQIWNRPDESAMSRGWSDLESAHRVRAKTDREREYIAALSAFYAPDKRDYQTRVEAYSAAMSQLYRHFPNDVDAGAFYALSLLADNTPDDTNQTHQREALAALNPLFATHPDHPGLAHYIIHACDNPAMARQGLLAAERYGEIAPSAPHAAHMPSHIFARLGMWQQDIQSNLASVAASQAAMEKHESGGFDQLHADDFLMYAYLQTGEDARAKGILDKTGALLTHFEAMPDMAGHGMAMMMPVYRSKFPAFYDLEMRDWKAAAALKPVGGAPPEVETLTYWARIVGAAHVGQAQAARRDLTTYQGLLDQIRKGKDAYVLISTGAQIEQDEALAWTAFAEGDGERAIGEMREAAELQDKVGQAEVDIPAREMLGDILLELHQPQQALVELDVALKMSPNRFNGLFLAGRAAEASGDNARATKYYAALLKSTGDGAQSGRPELAHVKRFVSSTQVATR